MRQLIIILFCVLVSCVDSESFKYSSLSSEKIIELDENLNLIGGISSFCIKGENKFIITTTNPVNVIEYSSNGDQVRLIGNRGNGPFEFERPSIVKVHNNKIYVWDSMLLKIIVFDMSGNPVKEYLNFTYAIGDFIPYKNRIIFYFKGGHPFIVGIYDLETERYLHQSGEPSQEHNLLSMNNSPGALLTYKDNVLYSSFDDLSIRLLSINNFENFSIQNIEYGDFVIGDVKDSKDMINTDMNRVVDYLMKNSYISNLFRVDNGFVLRTVNGSLERKENNLISSAKRYVDYFLLNENFEVQSIARDKYNIEELNIFSSFKEKIYTINVEESNNNYRYILNKIKFD